MRAQITLSQHVVDAGLEPEPFELEALTYDVAHITGLDEDGVRLCVPFTSIRYFRLYPDT
jgi:hypothetical protein